MTPTQTPTGKSTLARATRVSAGARPHLHLHLTDKRTLPPNVYVDATRRSTSHPNTPAAHHTEREESRR